MDWSALTLSLQLASATLLVLLPLGLVLGRWLARTPWRGKAWVEAAVVLPLVLPPTVLGYYLMVGLGGTSVVGHWLQATWGSGLVFHFSGLLLASVLFNIPFMVQPLQRAFEAIPRDLIEAAAVSGLRPWQTFWRVELPLAWPGLLSGLVLSFVHTLGEFGVVLMVGGNIPGETRTIAIAIYDRVQAFDLASADRMAALLLVLSLVAVAVSFLTTARLTRTR
ncbi:MAG TPA: molybdate ABC transporter permease subunit [Burkholderiaceae bacterium]|nr:molybdate ABC transporter permease subunit [Burkholderiaceae bacterium]